MLAASVLGTTVKFYTRRQVGPTCLGIPGENTAHTHTHVTLSRAKVLVTAKDHPASKALRIMAALVVGVAEARPNGFLNLSPHISTDTSTLSMGVQKSGREGVSSTKRPWRLCDRGRGTYDKYSTTLFGRCIELQI